MRAARMTLAALLPSRETPQATRSSSSGTRRPNQASTMASAGGAALGGLHLEDRGGANAPLRATARLGGHPSTPSSLRSAGMIRASGRVSSTMTSMAIRVPRVTRKGGPSPRPPGEAAVRVGIAEQLDVGEQRRGAVHQALRQLEVAQHGVQLVGRHAAVGDRRDAAAHRAVLLLLDGRRPHLDVHAGQHALGHVVADHRHDLVHALAGLADRGDDGARRHDVAAADADILDHAADRRLHGRADGKLGAQARDVGLHRLDLRLLLAFAPRQLVALLRHGRASTSTFLRLGVGDVEHASGRAAAGCSGPGCG